jgi:hypothetical protein
MTSANTDLQLKNKKYFFHCIISLNILKIKKQEITAFMGRFRGAYRALPNLS